MRAATGGDDLSSPASPASPTSTISALSPTATGSLLGVLHHNPFGTSASDQFSNYSLAPSAPAPPISAPPNLLPTNNGLSEAWEYFLSAAPSGVPDWNSAQRILSPQLVNKMLDAVLQSCCIRLPNFSLFAPRIEGYKKNLEKLDLSEKIIVTSLVALGARATTDASLLGVDRINGVSNMSSAELRTVGERREALFKGLTEHAVELCSRLEIVNSATRGSIEALSILASLLLYTETASSRARFFLRQAYQLYKDVFSLDLSAEDLRNLKGTIGPVLFETDARSSAYSGSPLLVREGDIPAFFEGTRVHALATLKQEKTLGALLSSACGSVDPAEVETAILLISFCVASLQRTYSELTSGAPRKLLQELPEFWQSIDRVHGTVQKLFRSNVSVEPGAEVPHADEHQLLLVIRMDVRIIDIMSLLTVRLRILQSKMRGTVEAPVLDALLQTSLKRVRKCFKLLAFYSKTLSESHDWHNLYHLFIQADVIPWIPLVVQRVGDVGGPISSEYEVSSIELDWLTDGLRLASFYTPLAVVRLSELVAARRLNVASSPDFSTPSSYQYPTPDSATGSFGLSPAPQYAPPETPIAALEASNEIVPYPSGSPAESGATATALGLNFDAMAADPIDFDSAGFYDFSTMGQAEKERWEQELAAMIEG
ncbi:hypothetical protein P7C70_g1686, partial [Phenoliferia sp. Uapishka_3]